MRLLVTCGRALALAAICFACSNCSVRPSSPSAQARGRRIAQTRPDPSGKWVAIVDEVEYANGLLTSVADRVLVVEASSKALEGTLVFSADALPDGEKPIISWASGRLVIAVSRNATVLHREARTNGFEVEVRPR